jgi:hypothetical protein
MVEAASQRLDVARKSTDRRSSVSLHEGESCVLRQTVTGLLAGQRMEVEHPPDEAWVLVIVGQISVHTGTEQGDVVQGREGDLMQLSRGPTVLAADDDCVVLLSVAKGERPR